MTYGRDRQMTYYVVVNRHKVAANRKNGTEDPVFRVSNGKYGKPRYLSKISFTKCTVVEDKTHPLPCGATVWIEAEDIIT